MKLFDRKMFRDYALSFIAGVAGALTVMVSQSFRDALSSFAVAIALFFCFYILFQLFAGR